MKKIYILLVSIGISTMLYPQAVRMAPLSVKVQNFNSQPLEGEQIWFESKSNHKVFKGISSEDGSFNIELEGGNIYDIKIKSIGEASEYSTIEIPRINAGEEYLKGLITISIEPARRFTLDNIQFDFGKSTLQKSSFKELEELTTLLKLKSNLVIEIGGHTDNIGNAESNLKLSLDRSNAVKNYLVQQGINSDRLKTKGYGETSPVASNETINGQAKNRRTEIRILN